MKKLFEHEFSLWLLAADQCDEIITLPQMEDQKWSSYPE
jgi:hypothetical protein